MSQPHRFSDMFQSRHVTAQSFGQLPVQWLGLSYTLGKPYHPEIPLCLGMQLRSIQEALDSFPAPNKPAMAVYACHPGQEDQFKAI